ncbi:hypothetical protein MD484_g6402, partial [Candolleomyces efflorescens]
MLVTSTGLRVLLASFLIATPALGGLLSDPSQLAKDLTYDYIVVGAGTAGNVVAHRLAEKGSKVLVLEAGVSDQGVLAAQVPFLGPTLTPGTPFDWNYTVAAQDGLNGRTFPYPRGKLLGGCSSVNYMVHQVGSSEDYDKLARDTGDSSWSWKNIRKFIFVHEKIVPPADGHNTRGEFIPENHGTRGLVSVSLPGNAQGIDQRIIATTKELAREFPFNPDTGGGNVLGVGWVQNSIGNGQRSSSSTTYLAEALKRSNVDVLINAHVTKLVQTGTTRRVGGTVPAFRALEFSSGPGASVTRVRARKEVILSAGAINTPQILLLSGIGPRQDLQALGIPTIVDNQSVGRNLSDHVLLPNIYQVKGSESIDQLFREPARIGSALDQWTNSKTGVLANGVTNHLGFFRLSKNAPIFATTPDPSTGPKASHWEIIALNFWLNPGVPLPPAGNFVTFISALISPTSRGFVKLASANPFTAPIIDPKFVTTQFDIFALREAVRAVKRFAGANAWKDYITRPFGGLASTSDADIDAYVRAQSTTVFHPVGTASMTAKNARWGVVDPDLKLKGADGVRVVDASIWPTIPNAHTQGPVYLIAEKAAALIASC